MRASPFLIFLAISGGLVAQDLEKLRSSNKVKVSGGLGFNSILNYTNQGENVRSPLAWFLSGSLTVKLLDWSIPISYTYSDQDHTFSQPFNRYGLQPKYKKLQGYLGYNSLSFSKYTLAGHLINGVGLAYKGDKWSVTSIYGRLRRTVQPIVSNSTSFKTQFKRVGGGLKVAYKGGKTSASISSFIGRDALNSIVVVPENTDLFPEQSHNTSADFKAQFTKQVVFYAEVGLMNLTRNLLWGRGLSSRESDSETNSVFYENETTIQSAAMKGRLDINMKNCVLSGIYERINPGFTSHGSYFFNNDLESIRVNPSLQLFKKKLSTSMSIGLQRNNLNGDKAKTTYRWIGSLNTSLAISSRFVLATSYNNFLSSASVNLNNDPLSTIPTDTLTFYQLSQTGSLVANHILKQTARKVNQLTLTGSYNEVVNKQGDVDFAPTTIVNANMSFATSYSKRKVSLSFIGNLNHSNTGENSNLFFGPGVAFSKRTHKKLNTNVSVVYNGSKGSSQFSQLLALRSRLQFQPVFSKTMKGNVHLSGGVNYTIDLTRSKYTLNASVNAGYSF